MSSTDFIWNYDYYFFQLKWRRIYWPSPTPSSLFRLFSFSWPACTPWTRTTETEKPRWTPTQSCWCKPWRGCRFYLTAFDDSDPKRPDFCATSCPEFYSISFRRQTSSIGSLASSSLPDNPIRYLQKNKYLHNTVIVIVKGIVYNSLIVYSFKVQI